MKPVKRLPQTAPELLEEAELHLKDAAGLSCRIYRIGPLSLIKWLRSQRMENRFYFAAREGDLEVAAVGIRAALKGRPSEGLAALWEKLNHPFFLPTLLPFEKNATAGEIWSGFPGFPFYLPELEVVRLRERYYFVRLGEGSVSFAADFGLPAEKVVADYSVAWREITEEPNLNGWQTAVEEALKKIGQGELKKMVLSRRWNFVTNGDFQPDWLLQKLGERREGYRFWFQPDAERVFWGNSPERLFKREGRRLYTEALAGTRGLEATERDRQALSRELAGNPKELAEHREVSRMIEKVLEEVCSGWECEFREEVVKHISVLHLATRYRGKLQPDADDLAVLFRLHPTPAVAGMPVEKARKQISRIEKAPRGLYSGAVGVLGKERSEFAVAIRSALWQAGQMTLFGGAGIVAGSRAASEWEETREKMKTILKIFTEEE
ncbi:MAG: isochorismate synthase [Calditrichia bacterium]